MRFAAFSSSRTKSDCIRLPFHKPEAMQPLVTKNAVESANRSFVMICAAFLSMGIPSALNWAHNRHTECRADQVSSGGERAVIGWRLKRRPQNYRLVIFSRCYVRNSLSDQRDPRNLGFGESMRISSNLRKRRILSGTPSAQRSQYLAENTGLI